MADTDPDSRHGHLLHESSSMLEAIRQAQARFIIEAASRESFGDLLDILLSITESEYGFIGEVFHKEDGKPFLKTHSISNIAWDEETLAMYEKYNSDQGMEFHNLETLFGAVLKTGDAVIANDPANDPRSGGLPPGHPVMHSFMGLPFYFNGKMVGMIGVANNPAGYSTELVDWLSPFLSTCATLIVGFRQTRERDMAERSLKEANDNFHALLQTVPDLMFELDELGTYINVWGLRDDLLLAPKRDLVGKSTADILPPEAVRQTQSVIAEVKRSGYSFGSQIYLPLPAGAHWFELSASKKAGGLGKADTYIFLARDVTLTKQAQEQLLIAAATFESQEAILITDVNAKVLRANKAFEIVTGYRAAEVIGGDLVILDPEQNDAAVLDDLWSQLQQTGKWVGEVWDRRKNGEKYPKRMTVTAVYGEDQKITNYVSVFTDISQRKQSEQEIHQLAFYDPLTRLPNRRLLIERLKQAMEVSQRCGRHGALLFLDLDQFKMINDTRGHATGDQLLIEVAGRLRACSRKADTVARMSGDEFVIVLEELGDTIEDAAKQADQVAEKIRAELGRVYLLNDRQCYTTPSIGIDLFLGVEKGIDTLFKNADIAMYQAKAAGRNAIRFFDPAMQVALEARSALEADLREALSRQQFTLHYQIQVDNRSRLLGAEALLRWQHPTRGLVLPDEFIPLAEETGLIVPIGLWVLRSACEQLREWRNHEQTSRLTLAVNVSARQFQQPDFVDAIRRILHETGADPCLLNLELTESIVLDNFERTIGMMKQLKSLGLKLSLDDFGTGQSSLKYLKKLPLDQIKIDRSFIRDIASDPSDAAIVNTIIVMSQAMDFDVIAEGVETRNQLEFLDRHGCRKFQGNLFGEPKLFPLEHRPGTG